MKDTVKDPVREKHPPLKKKCQTVITPVLLKEIAPSRRLLSLKPLFGDITIIFVESRDIDLSMHTIHFHLKGNMEAAKGEK